MSIVEETWLKAINRNLQEISRTLVEIKQILKDRPSNTPLNLWSHPNQKVVERNG